MTITEEWARIAPAGPELDRVCAEWLNLPLQDRTFLLGTPIMEVCRYYSVQMNTNEQRQKGFVCSVRYYAEDGDPVHLAWNEYFERYPERIKDRAEIVKYPDFSVWENAGPLFEAMDSIWQASIGGSNSSKDGYDYECGVCGYPTKVTTFAADAPLAIQRACAVLYARHGRRRR